MVVIPSAVKSVPVSKGRVEIPRTLLSQPWSCESPEWIRYPMKEIKANMLWDSRNIRVVAGLDKVCLIVLPSLGGKKAPCFFMVLIEVCRTLHTAPSDPTSSCQETDWRLIFCPCSTATSQAESKASVAGLAESHRGPRLGIPMVCPRDKAEGVTQQVSG